MTLNISTLVRETPLNGFLTSFHVEPYIGYRANNRQSALDNAVFVSDQINTLLLSGATLKTHHHNDIRINPLSVAGDKKLRLILHLSDLNNHLEKYHAKFEDLLKNRNVLPRHGFMTCFDLKSGYHHVFIHEVFVNTWDSHGKIAHTSSISYLLGLSPAPFIFTKLLRPLLARWRSQGMGVAIYLDDGLMWAFSEN